MFKRKCKITFIAHGTTIYSEENRIESTENYPPINEIGNEDMKKIVKFIKARGVKNDKIYVSPALKTIQSAEIIAKALKQDFEILPELTARDFGVWSGLTFDEIEDKNPTALDQFHQNVCQFCPEGGESILDFNKRTAKVLNEIVNKNVGKRIIIVTYPMLIQSAISTALQMPPENQSKIYIKPGSATQISYFKSWASLMYSGYIPM